MANFQKHGKNVHGLVVQAPPGGVLYEIGLWGPLDTRSDPSVELTVNMNPPDSGVTIKRAGMVKGQPVRVWQFLGLPEGKHLIEAKEAGGSVWTSVTIEVKPPPLRVYTKNKNETTVQRTSPTPKQVIDAVKAAWPALTENGARVLAAQYMAETGNGKYCFNYNFGNVKSANTGDLHMYLANVWECVANPATAEKIVAGSGGKAHIATAEETAKHNWSCASTIVVFNPPHAASRFRGFATLQQGAEFFVKKHQGIAGKSPAYLTKLNAGDTAFVAKTLKQNGYYSTTEEKYAAALKNRKADIDASLGAVE